MDALEAAGLKENTVILDSSDHGSHFRTRNAEYTRSCEDGCLHIPLLAWGGPFRGAGRTSELVSLIDVPPTILDIAGLEIPEHYRGHSLLQLARGDASDWPDAVYAQISEAENARTVRTKKWKYCVCAPVFDPKEAYPEQYVEEKLYDLDSDPFENTNLVSDPAYAEVRAQLRERLKAFMRHAHEPEAQIVPAG
jgi:arylsulfatase A-like enzyme